MSLNDLKSFWGEDSPIVKKIVMNKSLGKYKLPDVETEEETNAFSDIAKYLIMISQEKMNTDGYIDLDKEWATSEDADIVGYREQLFEEYPKPFCGRKAYLLKILLDKKKEVGDEGVTFKKTIKGIKTGERKDKSEYLNFRGKICLFTNKPPSDNTKKIVNAKNEIETIVDEDPYKYRYVSVFSELQLGKEKILSYVTEKLEGNPNLFDVICYGIAGYIKRDKLKDPGNKNPTPDDYWYNFNIDDVIGI